AAFVGAPYAVAAASGTAALHTALLAVGVRPGDEVLVPDLTFIAPANAVRYCGAFPVFMDVDAKTWHMDVEKTERFLNEECESRKGECTNKKSGRRVRAMIPVHILGLACEIDRLVEIARRHGLKVVEDAAEALGVRYKNRHVGCFGDAAAFSFNGNKIMTTGGGGMIVTTNQEISRYTAYLTTQAKDDSAEYFHKETGFNYRLSNIQAALGLAQLEQLQGFIARKRQIAAAYNKAFARFNGITPMPVIPQAEPTYWLYTILLKAKTPMDQRQDFIRRLEEKGIGARPLWHTLSDLPPFADCRAFEIEQSVDLYRRAVSLPSSTGLSDEDLKRCLSAVTQLAAHDA
ncbi:MAG: hypothetical protein A3J74_01230, partial [Elusimicrobia bacterium RIFCSPHIGHO2_02_FULL_57_9]